MPVDPPWRENVVRKAGESRAVSGNNPCPLLRALVSAGTLSDGSSELGLGSTDLRSCMDANFERAAGRRRHIDRALMIGEWPVLLKVKGKEGSTGRYLSLRDVETLFTKRRLPARMTRRLRSM
jgi:hypothetical protein